MVDNCGRQLDCGRCGGYSQCPHPNGICEIDLGEDEFNCKWECPVGCGDGICTLADRLRCPDDCGGAPPPDGISASGPYAGLVDEPVHFFGIAAPSVAASGYQWTFGDGAGADGLTPTHTYTVPGTYEVRLKATLLDGGELVSFTSARIAAQAGTSGFHAAFEMHYDPFGDGISATATIGPDGTAPPGSRKTPLTGIAIKDPLGRIVDQTGWMPAEAEADPVFVPALAHPMPGLWRGIAVFGYTDDADPVQGFIHPLGELYRSALVPHSQCNGCLTVAPSGAVIKDGATQDFTATPNSSPPPDSVAWGYTKPSGSSTAGAVDFSGSALNVSAHATWFAQPDQSCVSPDVLADQALRNAKYSISAAAQAGSQISTGQAELTVQMPWGIAGALGGTQFAAATFPPSLDGDFSVWCPTTPSPTNPCRISGNTLVRTAPTVCWPETQGHDGCAAYQQRYQLMPQSSSFRNKVAVHEAARAAWRDWSDAQTLVRAPGSEPEAYAISDGVAPTYLIQGCNH